MGGGGVIIIGDVDVSPSDVSPNDVSPPSDGKPVFFVRPVASPLRINETVDVSHTRENAFAKRNLLQTCGCSACILNVGKYLQ